MAEYEFLAAVRVIVAAHCAEDAREAAIDALSESVTSIETIEQVGGPSPSLSIISG